METKLRKAAVGMLGLACLIMFGLAGGQETATQTGKTGPVKANGDIKPPKVLKMIKPVYPEAARKEGIEGVVILEATADAKGQVEKVKVLQSVPVLDQAAIDAVKQWIYEPLILNGKPTPVVFTVTVRFTLDNKKSGEKGVSGGVPGGVAGGVQGGVKGGVQGGVSGGVQGGVTAGKTQEMVNGAVRAKDGIEPPKLIKSVDPVYPEQARKDGIEGIVILEAKVDVKGSVENVKVLQSIPALDQAAIDAVRQWAYEPLVLDGKPTPVIFTVTVRFLLK